MCFDKLSIGGAGLRQGLSRRPVFWSRCGPAQVPQHCQAVPANLHLIRTDQYRCTRCSGPPASASVLPAPAGGSIPVYGDMVSWLACRGNEVSCRCSSPKSRSRLRPHPKLKRPGPLAPGLRPDMPANSPHRPEWTHLQAPAAPTLTREGRCSACHGVPTSICQGEVQVCRGCLAVLWHLDRRPAVARRTPAEPREPERSRDQPALDAQAVTETPASSEPEPPPEPALRDEKGRFVRPGIVRTGAASEPPADALVPD